MKAKLLAASLLAAFAATAWANPAEKAVEKAVDAGRTIEQNFGVKVKSAKFNTDLNLFEVFVENGELIYVTPDKKYLFSGNIIDIASKKNVTRDALDELTKFSPQEIPSSFIFSRDAKAGKGQEVWVFVDPKCPFCRKLEPELDKMEDVKINYVPLAFQHSDTEVATVLCAKDKLKTWKEAVEGKLEGSANFTKSCMETAAKIREFAQSRAIIGTPTMIRADGARLSGYASAQRIIDFLNGK